MRGARDSGFVAIELAVGISALVLPVALVVLALPRWSERQTTARVIAREVARQAARDGWCGKDEAQELAQVMARNLGVPPAELSVELACTAATALAAGSDVEARVTVSMPAVQVPAFGAVGAWSWTASHREPVDRYAAAR
jgi:DNA-binding IclR family transcriptional regulator